MKSNKEIKDWLLKNCVDKYGDLMLDNLDFSDFNGNIDINSMKVEGNLYQYNQEVKGNLYQGGQKVEGNLYQSGQEVEGNLYQGGQEVEGDLYQSKYPDKTETRRYNDVYKYINKKHEIVIDGEKIELSEDSFNKLKESLGE